MESVSNARLLEFKISYSGGQKKFDIPFPTVGKFYDIEVQKQLKGKGFYGQVAVTNTVSAQHAADMIDMEACLSVLCPDMFDSEKGGFTAKSFSDIDIQDYIMLKKAYIDQFVPWWNNILDILKMEDKK